MKIILYLLIFLLLTTSKVFANQNQTHREMVETLKAYAVYKMGQYKEAFQAWMALAKKGNAQGILNVANMYQAGEGVPVDFKKAVEWYAKGEQLGDPHCIFNLALAYKNGKGVAADRTKALSLFEKAAESGSVDSMNVMANHALNKKDQTLAIKWLRRAADNGDSSAKQKLDDLLEINNIKVSFSPSTRLKLINFLNEKTAAANSRDAVLLTRALNDMSAIFVRLPGQSTYQKFSKKAYQDLWYATFRESERYRFLRTNYELESTGKSGHYIIKSEIDEFLYKDNQPQKLELIEITELTLNDGFLETMSLKLDVLKSNK